MPGNGLPILCQRLDGRWPAPVCLPAMPPRIALVTPFAFPSVRGNAVTVERIAGGLRRAGVALQVWDIAITAEEVVAREVEAFRAIVVHASNAYHDEAV